MCSLISLGSGSVLSDGSDCGGAVVGNTASEGNGSFSIGHVLLFLECELLTFLCVVDKVKPENLFTGSRMCLCHC